MPPKIKQEKLAKYKNRFVRKCLEKHPIKEVEQLPYDDLKGLWSQGKYIEFLEVALDKLKLLQSLPEVCPTLDLSVEEEVLKHLQDIDKTLRKFKKCFPSKHKDRRDEVLRAEEKLPTDLQQLLSNGDYKQFLGEALSKFARNLKLSKCLLAICPVLGLSNEKEVHKLVQRFFSVNCDDQETMDFTRSASKISTRMADHKAKIGMAKNLDVADFAVKVIFVDIRHYAPCIEGMFIEHFDPVWNRETLGISFGSRVSSLWRKYHVDEDLDVSKEMEQKLNISGGQSESESFDDLGQSDSESVAQSDSELESSDDLEQSDSD